METIAAMKNDMVHVKFEGGRRARKDGGDVTSSGKAGANSTRSGTEV